MDHQPSPHSLIALSPDWLIPMNGESIKDCRHDQSTELSQPAWLENHCVVIEKDTIVAIIPSDTLATSYPTCKVVDLPGMALIPGLINAHCHAAMSLLRGYSDDLPLKQWLEKAIWPVEAQIVDDEFVYEGTLFAIAEMLRGGTTCFQDMYFMPEQIAKAVQHTGIRANVGLMVVDSKTVWARDAEDCINKGLAVYDQFKHHSNLSFNFAPHAPYSVSKQSLQKVATLSFELSLNIQMHIHETAFEVSEYEKQHGLSPLAEMYQSGVMSPQLNAVHMTQLENHEIEWLAKTGTHVIHCPQSNMKLASGICPISQLIDAGVNVAIGTDGAASNNDLDMLSELQSAALLAKVESHNPANVSAVQALYAATMGGAKALGIEEITGSITVGKQADLVAIDLNTIETQPVYNPISQIVYAATRNLVTHVWVAGKQLLRDKKLTTLNEKQMVKSANKWKEKIQGLKND